MIQSRKTYREWIFNDRCYTVVSEGKGSRKETFASRRLTISVTINQTITQQLVFASDPFAQNVSLRSQFNELLVAIGSDHRKKLERKNHQTTQEL